MIFVPLSHLFTTFAVDNTKLHLSISLFDDAILYKSIYFATRPDTLRKQSRDLPRFLFCRACRSADETERTARSGQPLRSSL